MNPKILAATKTQLECELHENHPLRLVAAEGRRIHCVSGVVWITAWGHQTDIFLRPGMTFTIPNNGMVLAEGVESCRIRVDLPCSFDYTQYRTWAPRLFARLRRGLQLGWKRAA
jgi:hypothetical protein